MTDPLSVNLTACLLGNPAPAGFTSAGFQASGPLPISITPNAGYALDVLGFSFDSLADNSDSLTLTGFQLYTSIDAFSSPIFAAAIAPDFVWHHYSTALGSGPYLNLTSSFTIEFVGTGWPSDPPVALWGLDNITLDVDVHRAKVVPEPTTLALLGLGLAGLGFSRRKQ